jgi:hypothetical protein
MQQAAKEAESDFICPTCAGFGYRIEVEPGRTLNAEAARASGIKGTRVTCQSCEPKKGKADAKR